MEIIEGSKQYRDIDGYLWKCSKTVNGKIYSQCSVKLCKATSAYDGSAHTLIKPDHSHDDVEPREMESVYRFKEMLRTQSRETTKCFREIYSRKLHTTMERCVQDSSTIVSS